MVRSLLPSCIFVVVHGHGVMYEPPVRNSHGLQLSNPGCPGGSCTYFTNGITIGCRGTGKNYDDPHDHSNCENAPEPTIKFEDKHLRTVNLDDEGAHNDYTRHNPWRYPGSALTENPCGVAGGWYEDVGPENVPLGFAAIGSPGTDVKPLIDKTQWVIGSEVEVAWGINANHGGGYQYRLCPAQSELSQECFERTPLAFVGQTQWLQHGWGMDRTNRVEIPAVEVGGDLVVPVGSTWRRNPIPPCRDSTSGGAYNVTCPGPTFDPPAEGAWGYGGGSIIHNTSASHDDILKYAFDFGIVDKVAVPEVPPGEYVLQFRWDGEAFSQVWESCADVTIVSDGSNTEPFSLTNGCHMCCPETRSLCSNCTSCLNDKTGDCAYCWSTLRGYIPRESPPITCLGNEAEDGGAPEWNFGDDDNLWSPGCAKCWADETSCQPHFRPAQAPPVPPPAPTPAPPTFEAACSANPGCVAVGLTGDNSCCPAEDGTMLTCCDQYINPRSCAANAGCVAVGLTDNNNCCPADDGTQLACCDEQIDQAQIPVWLV